MWTPLRFPRFSLFVLIWHLVVMFVSAFNWRYFLSAEESMLGVSLPQIHLAFNIIGIISYICVSSILIFWPYRYSAFMLPRNRRNKMLAGIAVSYFSHVLPCFMMEFGIVWTYGWFSILQGTSFVLLTMTWVLETIGVWLGYIWHMSGFIHRNYGHTKFGQGYSEAN